MEWIDDGDDIDESRPRLREGAAACFAWGECVCFSVFVCLPNESCIIVILIGSSLLFIVVLEGGA